MRGWWFWAAVAAAFFLWPDDLGTGGLAAEIGLLLGALALATPVLVHFAILKNLPEDVGVTPVGDHVVPPEVDDVAQEYEDLGFQRAGPPVRVEIGNGAVLVALLHPREAMLATVFRIDAKPSPKLGYDVICILDAPESGLTTSMDPAAGVLPSGPAVLRQILPGATPTELLERHREAMRFVESHRLARVHTAVSAIVPLLKRSFALQRRVFLEARIAHTLTALWRTISRRNPHLGALERQSGIEDRLRAIPRSAAPHRAAPART